MTIRNAKLFIENKTKEFKLKDHLAYVQGEPETVAKDFNLYTETGIYSWSSVANILNSCPNRPTDEFGTLEVKNDHTGIIYQRYEAVNNVVYLRSHLNSKWTEWEKEVNQKYVDGEIKKVDQDLKSHNHDNVYSKLDHTHTKSQITDFPTNISAFTNDSDYQNATQVDSRIKSIVDSAPEALDTLKEIANALNNDPDFAATMTNELSKKANVVDVYKKVETLSKSEIDSRLKAKQNKVLFGTDAPSNDTGIDGDIYIQIEG